jgi:hypothetical protein
MPWVSCSSTISPMSSPTSLSLFLSRARALSLSPFLFLQYDQRAVLQVSLARSLRAPLSSKISSEQSWGYLSLLSLPLPLLSRYLSRSLLFSFVLFVSHAHTAFLILPPTFTLLPKLQPNPKLNPTHRNIEEWLKNIEKHTSQPVDKILVYIHIHLHTYMT